MRIRAHSKEALKRSPALTSAQKSNTLHLVARAYHAWRARSVSLLTRTPFPLEREGRLMLTLARPRPGEAWLDAGTSSGFYAGVLHAAGAQVTALDLSPAMLSAARDRHGEEIAWTLTPLERNSFPAGSFDGITVGATLNEIQDTERALSELQRLLRPGGRLWLMYVARSGGEIQGALARLGGVRFPDRVEVARALPDCYLMAALTIREVTFELFVRKPQV